MFKNLFKKNDYHYQKNSRQMSSIKVLHGDCMKSISNSNIMFQFIYLDPPYDTGRVFSVSSKDNIGFNDNFVNDDYCKFLDSCITECTKVLHANGVLCLHISAEQSFPAETVLCKHFKYINKIFWKRCHGKNTVKNKLGAVIDIIFECTNTKNKKFNLVKVPLGDTVWAFKNKDDRGNYSLGALKHDRTRKGHIYSITKDNVKYEAPYGWKIPLEEMNTLIAQDRIHFAVKAKNLYKKVYEHEHNGKPLSNLWDDIHSITRTQKDPRLYPTQKPVKLLERLLQLYTDEGDWVLDPVAGSGTTGEACKSHNRNAVLIDKNKDACDIMTKRLL